MFEGTSSRLATGILATGAAAGSLIEKCLFVGLGTGMDIGGGIPAIRTSKFVDLSGDGIFVRRARTMVGAFLYSRSHGDGDGSDQSCPSSQASISCY